MSTILSGALTMQSVPNQLKAAEAIAADDTIDLSQITTADSAGLAFLLELTRRANSKGRSLRFVGAPAQLVALSRFFELDQVINLTPLHESH